jgi:hypothetical protein
MSNEITFCTVSVNNRSKKNDYIVAGKKLAHSVLNYSQHKIVVITNEIESFNDIKNERLILIDCSTNNIVTNTGSRKSFNMNLKLHAIKHARLLNSDYVFYMDCDGYLNENWSDEIASRLLKAYQSRYSFDVLHHPIYRCHGPTSRFLEKKGYPHPWASVFHSLGYEKVPSYMAPQETLLIYKNNSKLQKFIEIWETFERKAIELNLATTTFIAIPIGVAQGESQMKDITFGKRRAWCDMLKGMGLYNLGKHGPIVGKVCW